MSVVFVLTFKAADGRYAELAETLTAMLPDTAARPGALLIRAAGDPNTGKITIYEEWDRPESREAYTSWRASRGEIGSLGPLLCEPPTAEQLAHLF
jgi:quinol monooxygenase YgiN